MKLSIFLIAGLAAAALTSCETPRDGAPDAAPAAGLRSMEPGDAGNDALTGPISGGGARPPGSY